MKQSDTHFSYLFLWGNNTIPNDARMITFLTLIPVLTSSGPVRTTAVFVPELSFSTAQTSAWLALRKLAPGSEDCSISLHGESKEELYGMTVFLSVCVFLSLLTSAAAIPVIWYQDPTVCKSIQYSLQSLQQRTGRWSGVGGSGGVWFHTATAQQWKQYRSH